ncbi:S9 family peptidase [Sphingobacterium sp. 2149]|uniref:S9 family peptidase n=1 Tax=Sphingobacterium sp. 2149 TaxID=2817763 RepID=UPI0028607022|nr:S9 family peptidase [Sphingobacterium sp. 2149]MDR6733539.1 dipeptidyl aminopeptidase/acylaminoacyl peptidase [Sphingobacterium sp. 2149]
MKASSYKYWKHKLIGLLLVGIAPAFAQGSATDSLIVASDLVRIKNIIDLQVKPDGSELAYAVRGIVADTTKHAGFRYETLWYVNRTASAAKLDPQQVDQQFTQILYSPDGRRWAVGKGSNKRSQLFLFPSDGQQPQQLTMLEQGVGTVRFSPDGSKVLISSSFTLGELVKSKDFNPAGQVPAWSLEKPADKGNASLLAEPAQEDRDGSLPQIIAYLKHDEQQDIAKLTNKLQFQTENSTTGEIRFTQWYVLDLAAKTPPVALTQGFRSHTGAEFVGNNKVLLSVETENGLHPDRVGSTDLVLFDLSNNKRQVILGDSIHRFQVAAVSASGKWVAVNRSLQNSLTVGGLFIYDTQNWKGNSLGVDRSLSNVQFAADEKSVYFIASDRGGRTLNRADIKSRTIQTLSSVEEGIGDYWVNGQKAFYTKTNFANPSELYRADPNFKAGTAITAINSAWLSGKNIGIAQKSSFRNEKGLEVDYWLLKPAHYQKDKRCPLLVEIHGGPASMFGPADAIMWHEYQYFRARGYAVLFSNPRGSSGYGEQFLKANFNDWGAGPSRDVLEAVDLSLATGIVDSAQLFITGGSYGAYLTAWILAHDSRFRAASSQRGVYDLYVFFGSANVWPMLKRYFDGFPWEKGMRDILLAQSPTTYAENIKTPLLIFHGEQDNRTGHVQSDFLYKQLKYLGRDTEYVRHPRADHEITRSGDVGQRLDQLLRTYEFFERYRH